MSDKNATDTDATTADENDTPEIERTVMALLLDDPHDWPWSIAELQHAIDDPITTHDAICGLRAHGLVHRSSDDLITPTRAALRMHGLE
jgi:hypothetical protein